MSENQQFAGDVLPVGYMISGRYRIESCLGSGGMGAVYLAHDKVLEGSSVAMKVLHREVAHDENHTKRFLREVQLMHRVNHPNVVRTYDVGKDGDLFYFTMEVAIGVQLEDMLRGGGFEMDRVADLVIQICEGLDAIHAADIIHRDLKPANIILVENRVVKITDFGVARPKSSELTQHNEIIGSVAYIAPEIWLGKPITAATDFYSLGVILYELVTGKLPFEGEEPASLMWMHVKRPPTPPKSVRQDIPNWINQLVLKLLAKSPADRPKSAREIIMFIQTHARRVDSAGGTGQYPPVSSSGQYQAMPTGTHPKASGGSMSGLSLSGSGSSLSLRRQKRRYSSRIREIVSGNAAIAIIAVLAITAYFVGLGIAVSYIRSLLLI